MRRFSNAGGRSMDQRSNIPAIWSIAVMGILSLVLVQEGIAEGRSPLENVRVFILLSTVMALAFWFVLFLMSPKPTASQKSVDWMMAFGFVTSGTLMISWQALFRPVGSYDRALGVAILLGALGLGYLSVRAFRQMRTARAQTDNQAPLDPQAPPRGAKSGARAIGLGIVACLSFLISIQQIAWPFQGNERELGGAGLITSAFFGYLSFRAYRNMKSESLQANSSKPPLVDNKTADFRNPKFGLALAVVLALFVIQGDVRVILKGDLQYGILQMAFWLVLIGYYGFREYGRMKRMKSG